MCAYECTFTKPALGIQVKDNAEGQIYITQMNPDVRAATNAKVGDEVTAINGISLVGLGTAGFKEKLKSTPGRPLVLTVTGGPPPTELCRAQQQGPVRREEGLALR